MKVLLYVIQWVSAIIAFATTAGYSGTTTLTVNCTSNETLTTEAVFGYPFRLSSSPYKLAYCDGSHGDATFKGDFSISAELFVFLGVITFLKCTVKLIVLPLPKIVRILTDWISRKCAKDCMACFQVSRMSSFAIMWLVSSSVWAKAVNDIKKETDPHHLAKSCMDQGCKAGTFPSMAALNASVIFGFFNTILYASFICVTYLWKHRGTIEDVII